MKFSRMLFTTSVALMTSVFPAHAAEKKADPEPIQIPTPPHGKGQIVFFRSSASGFAIGCSVNEGGQKISSLGANKFFIMTAEPGRHQYTVKSEASDTLGLEVEPDETQYAECRIKMGLLVGRPDIRPATELEFRKQTKLKMVDADDMGPGVGALRPADVAAALAAPKATGAASQ